MNKNMLLLSAMLLTVSVAVVDVRAASLKITNLQSAFTKALSTAKSAEDVRNAKSLFDKDVRANVYLTDIAPVLRGYQGTATYTTPEADAYHKAIETTTQAAELRIKELAEAKAKQDAIEAVLAEKALATQGTAVSFKDRFLNRKTLIVAGLAVAAVVAVAASKGYLSGFGSKAKSFVSSWFGSKVTPAALADFNHSEMYR